MKQKNYFILFLLLLIFITHEVNAQRRGDFYVGKVNLYAVLLLQGTA